jgi:tetratricopeptide (TPR) repeat protein
MGLLGIVLLAGGMLAGAGPAGQDRTLGLALVIDYPLAGSVFPPDFAVPTFLWRDSTDAVEWSIDVEFADGTPALHLRSRGERMQVGEIDPRAVSPTNKPPELTPEQAAAHTWVPDAATWSMIKHHSVERPAVIAISGHAPGQSDRPLSSARLELRTSTDPVGAPIFYRDVPLMPSETEQGVIKPLAPKAMPLIAWRLRHVDETSSRLLLTGMPTCANCHSFTRDGKTLAMDLDGPQNDKGLYALASVKPRMAIRNEDVVEWRSVRGKLASPVRVGFMSQISPDGQYVITTINPSEAGVAPFGDAHTSSGFYVANFTDYRFLQVFYLTRGVLAWYSRATGRLQPLAGASDPRYVQVSAFWAPDGKSLIFERAAEQDPYPLGAPLAKFANDPAEVQVQYDLYRIPFNNGEGGRAEPIAGASHNGMSNSFPKVSPDGRWIVFVKARNGQLMRPDSELWIVPAQGGTARRMHCNTSLMNSWHSFSPNGRWLAFSSKSRSPYTQLFLTHIDANGNDSPAILVENTTAANRAVNIPEFLNVAQGGLTRIDVPAVEFSRQADAAYELARNGHTAEAIAAFEKAFQLDPNDARARVNFGVALLKSGRTAEAIAQFEKARAIDPRNADAYLNLGSTLARAGKLDAAIADFEIALKLAPDRAAARSGLCGALAMKGGRASEALPHCEQALEGNAGDGEAHTNMAIALSELGRLKEAIAHLEEAAQLLPASGVVEANLGAALAQDGRLAEAEGHFENALELDPRNQQPRYSLGLLYALQRRPAEALAAWRQLLKSQPNHVPALVQSAHLLSTCPDPALRNGAEAVADAERAARITGGREPHILDALAAAYAEAGRFTEAAQTERHAMELAKPANDGQLLALFNSRLALYEARRPLREAQ